MMDSACVTHSAASLVTAVPTTVTSVWVLQGLVLQQALLPVAPQETVLEQMVLVASVMLHVEYVVIAAQI